MKHCHITNIDADWIGALPKEWTLRPLKSLFRTVGGSTPKSDVEVYWDGDVVWITPTDLGRDGIAKLSGSQRTITPEGLASCATTMVPPSSIILSTRAPIGSLGVATVPLCTNQGCKALVPGNAAASAFFAYVLSIATDALRLRGKGTTFLELSADELGAFKVPVPPLPEQTAIAAFLDRETGKIDALVEEQKRLIELLKEKRQAVISHAVTKGLNPDAPMKETGIGWLGEVPEHWSVARIKTVVGGIEQGWSPQCESFPVLSSEEWGVLKVGCVNGGKFDAAENKALPPDLAPVPELGLRNQDLLISRANTRELVGSAAVVEGDFPRLMLCDKLYRLKTLRPSCIPKFLAYFLGTAAARGQIELGATGASSSMLNIGQSTILELATPLPPVAEQISLISSLEEQLLNMGHLRAQAEAAIALLHERRAALISAAVTGKIDVRNLASEKLVSASAPLETVLA